MKSTKDNDKKAKKPYEPPRLFGLSGGVAHAAAPCSPGGSPVGTSCKDGGIASAHHCAGGATAGGKCQIGQTAAGGQCKDGGTASGKCKSGTSPA